MKKNSFQNWLKERGKLFLDEYLIFLENMNPLPYPYHDNEKQIYNVS